LAQVKRARAPKDIDFVLDVVELRSEPFSLGTQLENSNIRSWMAPTTQERRSCARCTGSAIAVTESELDQIAGTLPDGSEFAACG
jgi:hypothetical protein